MYHNYTNSKLHESLFRSKYGILYDAYNFNNLSSSMMEGYLTLRRTILISVLIIFYNIPAYVKTVYAWVVLFFLLIHLTIKPYIIDRDNKIETITLLLLSMIAILADGQQINESFEYSAQLLLIFLLLIPSCVLVLFILYLKITVIVNKRKAGNSNNNKNDDNNNNNNNNNIKHINNENSVNDKKFEAHEVMSHHMNPLVDDSIDKNHISVELQAI
jgi:hypothetical protein